MKQPFNHGYTDPLTEKSMNEMLGYTKALRDIYNYIKDTTAFNPEKRFIDSVPLLDKIGATNGAFSTIFTKEQELLQQLEKTINNG
jgi:hypothetical protein